MQTLWNRVAQTRSCKCSSCINHASKALSRRVTTAKKATKLRLTPEGFITFCSSATLASAAILDAAYKHKRRIDWDQAIREVKGEEVTGGHRTLEEETTCEQEIRAASDGAIPEEQDFGGVRKTWAQDAGRPDIPRTKPLKTTTIRTIRTSKPVWDGKRWTFPPSTYQSLMKVQLELLAHVINNPVTKEEWIKPPGRLRVKKKTIVSAETGVSIDYLARNPERNPKNYVQLEHMEGNVSRLVSTLIQVCKAMRSNQPRTEIHDDLNVDLKAKLAARIRELPDGDSQLPSYGPFDAETRESATRDLNIAISSVFKTHRTTPDLWVANICYLLLTWPRLI